MWIKIGIWVWGAATILMAAASLVFVIAAGFYVDAAGHFPANEPAFMPGMYVALKDNGSLVAAILAVSGLAWSYFFIQLPPRR